MKRRSFLELSAKTLALSAVPATLSRYAFAQDAPFLNLISVTFNQAWDVMLGLDPQVKPAQLSDLACYVGYRPEEILRAAGLNLGPAAKALTPYAARSIVINGVTMLGNVSHDDSRRLAITGILDRRTAEVATLKAVAQRERMLTAGIGYGLNLNLGEYEMPVGRDQDVALMIKGGSDAGGLDQTGFLAEQRTVDQRFGAKITTYLGAHPNVAARLNAAGGGGQLDARSSALYVAVALATGFANSVHIEISPVNGTLDTHSNHARDHLAAQANCFEQLAQLIQILSATPTADGRRSVFDETLILVTSDFSRESALNGPSVDTAGKEHNGYTNSYLLVGGALRGGFTIGESVIQANVLGRPSAHVARNFDFRTGRVIRRLSDAPEYMADPTIKKQIQPGHVVATLADVFGYRAQLDPVLAKLPTLKLFGGQG